MLENESLDQFLHQKRIDAAAFKLAFPSIYTEFERALQQGGSMYLDAAKKFQWNALRLDFPWGVDGLKKE